MAPSCIDGPSRLEHAHLRRAAAHAAAPLSPQGRHPQERIPAAARLRRQTSEAAAPRPGATALTLQRPFRGRPRSHARRPGSPAGVPSAILAPYSSTVMRSRDAHHDLHVVLDEQHGQALVVPGAAAKAMKFAVSWGFMPAVGSSRSSSLGFVASAPCDLEAPLVAVRQRSGVLLVPSRQAAVRQELLGTARASCSSRLTRGVRRIDPKMPPRGGCACRRARSPPRSSARTDGCSGTCGRRRARRSRAAACRPPRRRRTRSTRRSARRPR